MSDQKLRLTPDMRRVLRKAASLRPGNSVWAGDVYPAACIQALVRLLDVVNLLED